MPPTRKRKPKAEPAEGEGDAEEEPKAAAPAKAKKGRGKKSKADAEPPAPPEAAATGDEGKGEGACANCGSNKTNYGFTATDGKYTCHRCCVLNQRSHGFYGPPGVKSLAEAGGRICAECGTYKSSRWRSHKEKPGLYVCETCRSHYQKKGTYVRNAAPPKRKKAVAPPVSDEDDANDAV